MFVVMMNQLRLPTHVHDQNKGTVSTSSVQLCTSQAQKTTEELSSNGWKKRNLVGYM